ncbi:GAF domain-containing protein [Cytophagaceae bacterium DM2B3-1]|uniref:GAF domain-containing protein n=1 Tax=Xanthocytophaga flava TaxID=3048013 RepID=A0ABT7CUD5_9BACT|nr:GAF domain-containing protein [Xanthocytophaga flavus]MDJ1471856.1 GAF domain-containing protein [Xanthocytophaga flavus]MDJ1497121.1 GAF domain-containing protein [Xanthocytophaga flavus]
MTLKNFVRQNGIVLSAALVGILIILSAVTVFYNRHIMSTTTYAQKLSEAILSHSMEVQNQGLVNYDKNLRGFGITKDDGFIGHISYNVSASQRVADTLAKIITEQKALMPESTVKLDSFLTSLAEVKGVLKNYHQFGQGMIEMLKVDSTDDFKRALAEDRGSRTWGAWNSLHVRLETFEHAVAQKAQTDYDTAVSRNAWIQVLLLILGLPTLYWIINILRRQGRDQQALLKKLQETNQQYLFHPGHEHNRNVIEESMENLKKAAVFIKKITEEEDAQWEGLNDSNQALNQNNLVGELQKMQKRMKEVKKEDAQRNWTNEGLNFMGELLRKETDLDTLTNAIIAELVKYIGANQGGLFLLAGDDDKPYLELKAAYAYNRKKYLHREVAIGEGLVGQAVLEKDYIYLTDIPQDYLKITSGLGMANPTCLLIMPMKVNENVQGVIELASFEKLEGYKIAFIEKLAQQMASTIVSVRTNERTRQLLDDSQQQAEEMKSQEEEMRQNMEELAATQEEMFRKEQEYLNQIQELQDALRSLQEREAV